MEKILQSFQFSQLQLLLLLLSGDVESNPGPFPSLPSMPSLPSFDKKEDPVEVLQEVVDEQADKIRKHFDLENILIILVL